MVEHLFSKEEIDKLLELSKQNPVLVKELIDAKKMDYSATSKGEEVNRFDYNDIETLVNCAKENSELVSKLLRAKDNNNSEYSKFNASEIEMIVAYAKDNPEIVDLLLNIKKVYNDGSVYYTSSVVDISLISEQCKNDKDVQKKVKSLINRGYEASEIINILNKETYQETIDSVKRGSLAYDLEPLTNRQNQFFDMLLNLTKDAPIDISKLQNSDFGKALRELKPKHYTKVLSFIEKFPNSVDRIDAIIRRLNINDTTEMEEFLMSPSYTEDLKRNSAGKYQKEMLDMFTPENIQAETLQNLLRMTSSKEDFLNGIKKMSKSTFKLAYDRPNQYLSSLDLKYTNPVDGKLPELSPEDLDAQRKLVKNFFGENIESLVRILKYVDTDTVSHMMDRRTDLFKKNMENLNSISDENYELLSKALQCKSSVSGKQLSPKEKLQLTQIMYIFDSANIDTSSIKDEVQQGTININNFKTTIQNEVLKAAGVDTTDTSLKPEKKQFNPEFAYLVLMNPAEEFESIIDVNNKELRSQFKTQVLQMRKDSTYLAEGIEAIEFMLMFTPKAMRQVNLDLLEMVKNIDDYSDEELINQFMKTVHVAVEMSKDYRGKDNLFTVINASATGDFNQFINDPSNKYGQTNANTAQIFKNNGLDYNQWLKPSVDDVKLNVAGKDMSIRLWDRNPQEDLFMGNKTTCCTAIGTGGNAGATPLYLLNTSFNVAMLYDSNGNVVGMSRVFMTNVDGKPSLIMDNIELNKTYVKGMTEDEKSQIRDGFFEYMNKYSTQVTGDNNSQVYFYSGDIHVPTSNLDKANKVVDFIGDFSDKQVYVNSNHCKWMNPKDLKNIKDIEWLIVPRN